MFKIVLEYMHRENFAGQNLISRSRSRSRIRIQFIFSVTNVLKKKYYSIALATFVVYDCR